MKKVKMKQIAEMAGVSTTMVSRTFRSPHLVNMNTRARILHLGHEKQYVYDAAAGDLSRKTSTVIDVVVPTTKQSLFGTSLLAIQDKTRERDFSIVLGNTKYDEEIELKLLRQFQERRVAGIVLTGFTFGREKALIELIEARIPVVVIWEKLGDPRINYVGFDNFQTAYLMTEHLIKLGHQRIGLIIGPYSKVGRVRKRLAGYKSAMTKSGLDIDPTLIIENEPTAANGYSAMARFLQLSQQPTAVFAASDVLAIGALTVKILLEAIESGNGEVKQYSLDTDLIIRESCTELD